ncbi:hypothetical protein KKG52_02635 [Patescibacteria group bacterium]|nr:hypothetical protein [Patescibacteria group bacterium]
MNMAKKKQVKNKKGKKTTKTLFSPRIIGIIADEVAKTVINRLPSAFSRPKKRKKIKKIENPIFLDTSAIIDGRIFDVIELKVFFGTFIILESVLSELKHIADSPDGVKKDRGRRGLEYLEKLKKNKSIKKQTLDENSHLSKIKEVDDRLVKAAKMYKGKLITCDYNLEKKATIDGVTALNVYTLANVLKITAIPGEKLSVKILHEGKDVSQGVAYFDDGTMIVVENASVDVGKTIEVVVSRVIQTAAGKIFFSKKSPNL